MNQGISLAVYPVQDLAKAKALFSQFLGVQPYVDGAYYVGFRVGDQEVGLDPNAHRSGNGHAGPIGYRMVENIQQALQALVDAGAQVQQDIKDVGGGLLIAQVKDADGNLLGLRQKP